MGLYSRKGSKFWWMTFMHEGKQRVQSTGTTDRAEAERVLANRKAGIGIEPVRRFKVGPRTGVYFIVSDTTGFVKIGWAVDVDRRKEEIRTYSGDELRMVGFIPTEEPAFIEKMIHRHFADRRIRREWFSLTETDALNYLGRVAVRRNRGLVLPAVVSPVEGGV